MNRRAAVRRRVVASERRGDWGESRWYHQLSCGHVEVRPRAAAGPTMTCASCITRSMPAPQLAADPDQQQFDELRLAARIAGHFGVRVDDVTFRGSTATVFLDAETLAQFS